MYINPDWRILTVGDGDLSFSNSLLTHHKPKALTATVLDDESVLNSKYQENHLSLLSNDKCQVFTGVDVTDRKTWPTPLQKNFDVVFFQFPLIPAFVSAQEYQEKCRDVGMNTLHRRLLRQYLLNCFDYFLDEKGSGLAFITSKDVNPYCNWHIETALTLNTDILYLGSIPFDMANFPGYKIRNVDRDKHVKCTQGFTFVFSKSQCGELDHLLVKVPENQSEYYCQCCRINHFETEQAYIKHLTSKKHRQMAQFEQEWLLDIKAD